MRIWALNKDVVLRRSKQLATFLGARLTDPWLCRFQGLVNYMRLGRWMHEHGFQTKQLVPDRNAVFASVARKVRNERVLYLEFGVFEGASIRYWSRELQHPDSILHGFDSFEGLPEDFDVSYHYSLGKGAFSTQGRVPVIHDKRVKFFKGWFDQVLPGYSVPPHNVLVINMDADLYSSTLYVLRHLRKWIRCGTFIYFDEMSRLEHEPRAFEVFLRENKLSFRLVCADQSLNNAFFECIGEGAGGSQV